MVVVVPAILQGADLRDKGGLAFIVFHHITTG